MILARLRLRATYALLAGLILLLVLPIYQSAVLVPTGYGSAVRALSVQHSTSALLAWISTHQSADRVALLLQLAAFLLAVPLPTMLWRVLWPDDGHGRLMLVVGTVGFLLQVLSALVSLLTVMTLAGAYGAAPTEAARAMVGENYTTALGVMRILGQIVGGFALALFLALVNARIIGTGGLSRLLGLLGMAAAALMAGTALFYVPRPAVAEVATSTFAALALALWLTLTGISLWRVRNVPNLPQQTVPQVAKASTAPTVR